MVGTWEIVGTEADWSAIENFRCGTALGISEGRGIGHVTLQSKGISRNVLPSTGIGIFASLMNLKYLSQRMRNSTIWVSDQV